MGKHTPSPDILVNKRNKGLTKKFLLCGLEYYSVSIPYHYCVYNGIIPKKGDFPMKRRPKGDQFTTKGLLGDLGLL